MSLKVIDSNSVHFGMKFRNDKIGDGLIYSSCPENFHLSGKGKILDIEKIWFLDHNPFVVRNTSCNQHIDMQSFAEMLQHFLIMVEVDFHVFCLSQIDLIQSLVFKQD